MHGNEIDLMIMQERYNDHLREARRLRLIREAQSPEGRSNKPVRSPALITRLLAALRSPGRPRTAEH